MFAQPRFLAKDSWCVMLPTNGAKHPAIAPILDHQSPVVPWHGGWQGREGNSWASNRPVDKGAGGRTVLGLTRFGVC